MKLDDIFREHEGKEFVFVVPNSGNHGDELIRMGAEKLAKIHNVSLIEMHPWQVKKDHKINNNVPFYIHGSGGIGIYEGVAEMAKKIRGIFPESLIVCGPTTSGVDEKSFVRLRKEFMEKDENFIFFAREMTTYNFMKEHFSSRFQIMIDECPSLSLCREDMNVKNVSRFYSTLLLREDAMEKTKVPEAVEQQVFEVVADVADRGTFEEWVNAHNEASPLITNRLHSAILGSILGNDVTLFANSYHKNKSMWRYSLKRRGVKWIE